MKLYLTGCLKGGGSKETTFAVVLQRQTCRKFPGTVVECKILMTLDIGK